MRKTILTLAASMLLCSPALAQTQTTPTALAAQINNAVCANDWNGALNTLQRLIGNSSITPEYRQQLVAYRTQVEGWRASGAQFNQSRNPNCRDAIAAANAAQQPQQASRPIDWDRAAAVINAGGTNRSTNTPSQATLSADDRRMVITAYADGYCEARRRGMTDQQATSDGTRAMGDYLTGAHGLGQAAGLLSQVNDNDLIEAMNTTSALCPEFSR
jgi:hypothetical protein